MEYLQVLLKGLLLKIIHLRQQVILLYKHPDLKLGELDTITFTNKIFIVEYKVNKKVEEGMSQIKKQVSY